MKGSKATWAIIPVFLVLGALLIVGTAVADRSSEREVPAEVVDLGAANTQSVYSSGWVDIAPLETRTFTHSLGGDPDLYAVELWFRDTRPGGLGIHHRAYGGMDVNGQRHGVHWEGLTDTSIDVTRHRDDVTAAQVYLRVRQIDPPRYDSDWVDIDAGWLMTLTHSLGGDVDDYTAGVRFRDGSTSGRGIHQYAIGGLEADGAVSGACWQQLTDSTVQIVRFAGDVTADQLRLYIDIPDPPAYDSDWVDVARGETVTLTHGLGGNANTYVVRASARSTAVAGLGINCRGTGGLEASGRFWGGNWERLTDNTVNVFRRGQDSFADQMRVRIWRPEFEVLLPLVVSDNVVPTELAYDDGSAESSQSYVTGSGFAVRFTAPGDSAQLVGARYFFMGPVAPIEVHVWDADRNDLITPFTATPTSDGWFDVDIGAQNVVVSGDFYVGFLHTVDADPTLGVDTSQPDGRSHEVPWEEKNLDYLIRAVLAPS